MACWLTSVATQETRFAKHIEALAGERICVIECGAGTAISSVRDQSECLVRDHGAKLVRINLEDSHLGRRVPAERGVGMACGALQALRLIDAELCAMTQ